MSHPENNLSLEISLTLSRHLAALTAALLYTMIYIYLYHGGYTRLSGDDLFYMLFIFWVGNLLFTTLLITGLNKYFRDRSLSVLQLIWATVFAMLGIYFLNDMRDIILMFYFAMLSFGFFRFKAYQFVICAVIAIVGYLLVIFVLSINEPLRITYNREILRFFAFTLTSTMIVYSGISISRMREELKRKNIDLEKAVELNTILATTDDLTGLYTRRHFMEVLAQQKAISERDGKDFVVCFADLDFFKHVNDAFGHHTGDLVLKQFADIVRKSIREVDYAARFGGEEFVLLLVNTDIEQSISVAERIRQTLDEFNFNDIAPALNVTVSIGMSNYKEFNSLQETLMSADNRMYAAKEQGRNLVVSS
jgi:diguanylate cyclase (GGDEF)-like protein